MQIKKKKIQEGKVISLIGFPDKCEVEEMKRLKCIKRFPWILTFVSFSLKPQGFSNIRLHTLLYLWLLTLSSSVGNSIYIIITIYIYIYIIIIVTEDSVTYTLAMHVCMRIHISKWGRNERSYKNVNFSSTFKGKSKYYPIFKIKG